MPTISVRCLQGWKGVVETDSGGTLDDFVSALCDTADLRPGDVLSIIVRGKRLDPAAAGAEPLSGLGVVHGTPVMLVLRSPEQRALIAAQEKRAAALREVELAAAALSSRVGLGPMDQGYELSLTNQDGTEIAMEPTDRKAFTMGCLLHSKGQALLRKAAPRVLAAIAAAQATTTQPEAMAVDEPPEGAVPPAPPLAAPPPPAATPPAPEPPALIDASLVLCRSLEDAEHILEQAEQAFTLVSPKYLALGDNLALLLLDLVWGALLRHLLRPLCSSSGGGGGGGGAAGRPLPSPTLRLGEGRARGAAQPRAGCGGAAGGEERGACASADHCAVA